jgi:hypothetical protein
MNFNLEVSQDPKEISKILTDVRYLLKDVVLPQILRQEIELKQLREQTWPVCQSIREQSQISDIANKIEFLNDLDFNEIIKLLKNKAKISSTGEIKPSTSNLLLEEIGRLGLS